MNRNSPSPAIGCSGSASAYRKPLSPLITWSRGAISAHTQPTAAPRTPIPSVTNTAVRTTSTTGVAGCGGSGGAHAAGSSAEGASLDGASREAASSEGGSSDGDGVSAGGVQEDGVSGDALEGPDDGADDGSVVTVILSARPGAAAPGPAPANHGVQRMNGASIRPAASSHACRVVGCNSPYSIDAPASSAGSYGTTATPRVRLPKWRARSSSIGEGRGVGSESRVTALATSSVMPASSTRSSIQSAANA